MGISSKAVKAGEAFVQMIMDDEQFADSIRETASKINDVARPMRQLGTTMAAIGGSISAPFILGTRNLLTFTAEIDRAAARLGVPGESFAQLSILARVTGVELAALEVGMKTIGERLIQLRQGSSETADAFRMLGINFQRFQDSTQMERLFEIAEAMGEISDEGMQSGLALRVLGEAGNRLLPLLRLGSELRNAQQFVASIAPNQEQLRAARQLALEWELIKVAGTTLSAEVATTLVPTMIDFIRVTRDATASTIGFVRANESLVATIGVLGVTISAVGGSLVALSGLGFLFTQAATGLGIFVRGLAALRALLPVIEVGLTRIRIIWVGMGSIIGVVVGGLVAFVAGLMQFSGIEGVFANLLALAAALQIKVLDLALATNILSGSWREAAEAQRALARDVLINPQRFVDRRLNDLFGTDTTNLTPGAPAIPAATTAGIQGAFAGTTTLGGAAVSIQEEMAQSLRGLLSVNSDQLNEAKSMRSDMRKLFQTR